MLIQSGLLGDTFPKQKGVTDLFRRAFPIQKIVKRQNKNAAQYTRQMKGQEIHDFHFLLEDQLCI